MLYLFILFLFSMTIFIINSNLGDDTPKKLEIFSFVFGYNIEIKSLAH